MKEKKLPNTRIAVADGLVNLKHGVVSHPYPEVHLELAAVLVYP